MHASMLLLYFYVVWCPLHLMPTLACSCRDDWRRFIGTLRLREKTGRFTCSERRLISTGRTHIKNISFHVGLPIPRLPISTASFFVSLLLCVDTYAMGWLQKYAWPQYWCVYIPVNFLEVVSHGVVQVCMTTILIWPLKYHIFQRVISLQKKLAKW